MKKNKMRPKRTTPATMHRAASLRKLLTPAEAKLWAHLRNNQLNGASFRRQHAIGPYITDFCSPRWKLIIELDGSQHLNQEQYDNDRTVYLEGRGYQVLRFWNNDVLNNLDAVAQSILNALDDIKR